MPRGSETVTIHPYPGKTPTGDLKPALPTKTAQGCIIWPRTNQDLEKGDVIIDGLNVYVPPGEPRATDARDQVTARGKKYEIDGPPGDYVKPAGDDAGQIIVLKRLGT